MITTDTPHWEERTWRLLFESFNKPVWVEVQESWKTANGYWGMCSELTHFKDTGLIGLIVMNRIFAAIQHHMPEGRTYMFEIGERENMKQRADFCEERIRELKEKERGRKSGKRKDRRRRS
jgi:hypothetical protein